MLKSRLIDSYGIGKEYSEVINEIIEEIHWDRRFEASSWYRDNYFIILKGDPRIRDVIEEIAKGAKAYTSTLNLSEIYYKAEEKLGRQTAITWFNRLAYFKDLNIVSVDLELTLETRKIKARHRKPLSIVDAIPIALAKKEKVTLLTIDNRLKVIKEIETNI